MADGPTRPASSPDPGSAPGIVRRSAAWAAAAGLIPVPLVALAILAGVQLRLLRRLSTLRGPPSSLRLVGSIAASLAGSFAATWAGLVVLGPPMKLAPLVGGALGVLAAPLAAAATTWLLGRAASRLWLGPSPPSVPPAGPVDRPARRP